MRGALQSAVSEFIYHTRQGLSKGQDRTETVSASFWGPPEGSHLAGFLQMLAKFDGQR